MIQPVLDENHTPSS